MRVMVTGGGTGGHIYPALAFLKYLKSVEPDTQVLYVGTKKGLEDKIVPEAGVPFETIEIQGFRRSLSPENIRTVYLFLNSLKRAKKLIREFKPDVVIGTGGYVSGSVVYMASKLGIPTIVHEQNSVPGVTNKFLSRYATKIATSFHGVEEYFPKEKVVFTGNPRAQEVTDISKSDILKEYDLKVEQPTVVIFGGSRGALKINQAFVEALPKFEGKNYQVLYASGERYYKEFEENFKEAEDKLTNVRVRPYISKMADVLANANLMVGRAGATSIAEMTALGLPGILIPSPYVTNDHQTKNAQNLVNAGAVLMIKDDELTGESLVQAIDSIMLDKSVLEKMSQASLREGVPNSAEKLLSVVKEIIK